MAEAMPVTPPAYHADVERCVDAVLAEIGNEIVLALPLGLGKAYQFANALYGRATRDSSLKLTILTALTLEKPTPSGELEQRLSGPIVQRRFSGCPELAYAAARRRGALPTNIKVHEFFFQTGALLSSPGAQQDYISTNYTQAVRDLLDHGVNVLGQLVARRTRDGRTRFSLSCNPDVTLDLLPEFDRLRRAGVPIALVAEVNRNLPFMPGDAEVDPAVFDHVVENEATHYQLFTLPRRPVSSADHVAGLHVASLIRDGGTLQLGIGSIGDAVTYALKLRHQQNARFQDLMSALAPPEARSPALFEAGEFEQGLYAASEMFVEGFLELWRAGILRRKVYGDARLQALLNAGRIDEPVTEETLSALRDAEAIGPRLRADDVDFLKRFGVFREGVVWRDGELLAEDGTKVPGNLGDPEACARIAETCLGTELKRGVLLHGAFFLGTRGFYRALNGFSDEEHALFAMTAVAYTNSLRGDRHLKALQRRDARFVNNALLATLTGAVVADGLEDGRIVSGVGGQHDFVVMAHELQDARAIVVLNSTREKDGRSHSNIVWNYGHVTIPRHLRDIVVTEYGVADLRGRSDRDVIAAMLNIADSRFQPELLAQAKAAGKIEKGYAIPAAFRENTPQCLDRVLRPAREAGLFPDFPFGSDLVEVEAVLLKALRPLAKRMTSPARRIRTGVAALREAPPTCCELPYLERLALHEPRGVRERLLQKVVLGALRSLEHR